MFKLLLFCFIFSLLNVWSSNLSVVSQTVQDKNTKIISIVLSLILSFSAALIILLV